MGEDTAYEALLAKVDQSDFGGALRNVFLDDAMRHPLRFAKAGLDLSAGQAAIAARAASAHSAGETVTRLLRATTACGPDVAGEPGVPNACESYLSAVQWAQQLVDFLTRSRRPA